MSGKGQNNLSIGCRFKLSDSKIVHSTFASKQFYLLSHAGVLAVIELVWVGAMRPMPSTFF